MGIFPKLRRKCLSLRIAHALYARIGARGIPRISIARVYPRGRFPEPASRAYTLCRVSRAWGRFPECVSRALTRKRPKRPKTPKKSRRTLFFSSGDPFFIAHTPAKRKGSKKPKSLLLIKKNIARHMGSPLRGENLQNRLTEGHNRALARKSPEISSIARFSGRRSPVRARPCV